ncbi:copper resistance protein CopC [Glycomyces tarimensis]
MSRLHPLRLAWLPLAAAVLGALWASPANAHALATGTDPASDEVLDSPPGEVVVEFNEPVTPVDAATGVVAPDGDRADTGIVETGDDTTVVIGLDAQQEGTYLVGYRVVSHDGHPVSGTFTFSVGTETEPPSADALAAETDPLVQGLLYAERGVGYAGLALALGTGVLLAVGARPRHFGARLVAVGLSAVAISAVAGIVLQAAYESGVAVSALDAAALQSVMESNVGLAALLRLLVVLLAMPLLRALITTDRPGTPALAGLAGVGLALTATWPLAGHPMATEPVVAAFAADWLHAAAGLTWAGGVAALLVLAIKSEGEVPPRAREFWVALVPWLMAVIIVAGLSSALLHIDSFEALTDTTYGRLVVLKAAILVVIVAVGLGTRRALLRGTEGRTALRRLAGAEVALAAAVLAAVVVLVQVVPAKTALLESEATTVESTGVAGAISTDMYTGQVVLEPGRPGPNSVRIIVWDLAGQPFDVAEWEALWGLEGAEPDTLRLIELRTGILGGEVSLPEAGRYIFTVTLTDAEGRGHTAEVAIDVSLPVAEGRPGVLGQLHAPLLEVPTEVVGEESGGVVRQRRMVAVPADRHRRHERGVGLDQDQLRGGHRGRAAQRLGVLERHVPREAHVEPAPGAFVGEREVA